MQTLSPNSMPSYDEHLPAIAANPTLQAALNGLDTTLNDELERYRHWQRNGQTISYLHPFHARAAVPQIVEPILPKRPTPAKAPRNREPELPVTPPMPPSAPEAAPSVLQDLAAVYQHVSYERQQQEVVPHSEGEPAPPGLWRSLLTPVGVGSVLLLLLSSAAIGYVLVDPAGLTKLLQPQPEAVPPTVEPEPVATPTFSPIPPVTPPADSFTRPSTPTATPTPPPQSSLPPLPAATPRPVLPQPVSPVALPEPPSSRRHEAPAPPPPVRLRVAPEPAATRSAPEVSVRPLPPPRRPAADVPPVRSVVPVAIETPPPAPAQYAPPVQIATPQPTVTRKGTSSHRVVVDATYSSQVQQIRQEAYIRPDDGKVQVGAYQDVNAAQQQVEELRRQGIPARVE